MKIQWQYPTRDATGPERTAIATVDQLTYKYTSHSNKLTYVTDGANDSYWAILKKLRKMRPPMGAAPRITPYDADGSLTAKWGGSKQNMIKFLTLITQIIDETEIYSSSDR